MVPTSITALVHLAVVVPGRHGQANVTAGVAAALEVLVHAHIQGRFHGTVAAGLGWRGVGLWGRRLLELRHAGIRLILVHPAGGGHVLQSSVDTQTVHVVLVHKLGQSPVAEIRGRNSGGGGIEGQETRIQRMRQGGWKLFLQGMCWWMWWWWLWLCLCLWLLCSRMTSWTGGQVAAAGN